MSKIIKEIIIMLLVCLATMLVLGIVLYQYLPKNKSVPEITKYVATEQVQDLLEDNIDQRTDKDRVILTYEVTKGDLSGYQTTNDYVPGKSNPFAVYSKSTTETEGNGTQSSENGENTTSGETNETKVNSSTPSVYENTGTK